MRACSAFFGADSGPNTPKPDQAGTKPFIHKIFSPARSLFCARPREPEVFLGPRLELLPFGLRLDGSDFSVHNTSRQVSSKPGKIMQAWQKARRFYWRLVEVLLSLPNIPQPELSCALGVRTWRLVFKTRAHLGPPGGYW